MRRRWKKAENANAGSAVSVDGACVLMARSGTAREPMRDLRHAVPLLGKKTTTRTKNVVANAPSNCDCVLRRFGGAG